MRWTRWRKIAYGNEWDNSWIDHRGAACYELGTGGPRGGQIRIHYVGETGAEHVRIACYARSGSHLSDIIDEHLRRGWHLYYRAIACRNKAAAKQLQDNLLRGHRYDWNTKLNR